MFHVKLALAVDYMITVELFLPKTLLAMINSAMLKLKLKLPCYVS